MVWLRDTLKSVQALQVLGTPHTFEKTSLTWRAVEQLFHTYIIEVFEVLQLTFMTTRYDATYLIFHRRIAGYAKLFRSFCSECVLRTESEDGCLLSFKLPESNINTVRNTLFIAITYRVFQCSLIKHFTIITALESNYKQQEVVMRQKPTTSLLQVIGIKLRWSRSVCAVSMHRAEKN